MKTQRATRFLTSLVALTLCLTGSVLAQKPTEPIATISFDSSDVRWQPHFQGEYARIVLTVSTPGGEVLRKAFDKGVSPWFKLTDESGKRVPDGAYQYELIIIPELSPAVKQALAAAREDFEAALDDDLNTSGALGALFVLIGECNVALAAGDLQEDNRTEIAKWFEIIDERLAVMPPMEQLVQGDEEIEALVARRNEARRNRDFAMSDKIRQELLDRGVLIEDTREGTRWRHK